MGIFGSKRVEVKPEVPVHKSSLKHPVRGFSMADGGDLLSDWAGSPDEFNQLLRSSISIMRKRARDLSENDPYVVRFRRLMKTNVIGPHGIKLVSKCKNDQGQLDVADKRVLEKAWAGWGELGTCTMDGLYDWPGLLSVLLDRFLIDGEVLLRLVPTSENRYGFAVQLVDPVLLDHTLNRPQRPGTGKIKNGVEVNEWGRPVAYWFHDGSVEDHMISGGHKRVPAENIRHWFQPERQGQTRGVSWLAPTGARKRMLDGFEYAAVVGARAAASKMGFYKIDPEAAADLDLPVGADGSFRQDVAPGQLEVLPPGYSMDPYDPTWPGADYEAFSKSVKRSICAGLNVSYNTVGMDLESVSWSGLRAAELQDREFYKVMQAEVVKHVQAPVFKMWLRMYLDFSDTVLPRHKYEKYLEVAHRPRGFSWVDPEKQEKANALALQNRTTTLGRLLEETHGLTVEEYKEELDAEIDTMGTWHPLHSAETNGTPPEDPTDGQTETD